MPERSPFASAREFPLAEEQPVAIYSNGKKIAVLMCTPSDLAELAWGHLVTRGLVPATAIRTGHSRTCDTPSIKVCQSRARVDVESGMIRSDSGMDLGGVIASGCGSGALFSQEFLFRPRIECGWSIGRNLLAGFAQDMFANAEMYRNTGGMHCAAIAKICTTVSEESVDTPERLSGETYFVTLEDVGRHNAVDKVVGKAILDGVNPGDCVLLTSGRIAADMALKAVVAGIPIVVSRSIPTTTAYEIAQRAGLTLIGRIGSKDPVIYTNPERIRQEEPCLEE